MRRTKKIAYKEEVKTLHGVAIMLWLCLGTGSHCEYGLWY